MMSTYRRINVEIPGKSYPVYIGKGLNLANMILSHTGQNKKYIISFGNFKDNAILLDLAKKLSANVLLINDDESKKSLPTVNAIYSWLLRNGIQRNSTIVAIGGGVVCDIAGFVAATILRGIKVCFLPTTLLSQVDAAIGGKNGVNLENNKNTIGTIYQPEMIACDLDFLKSLSQEQFNSGMAEVIKHSLIADANLFNKLSIAQLLDQTDSGVLLADIILTNVAIKADVVAKDENENDLRRILNFGHSLGHLLESYYDYKYTHGASVMIGMVFASYISLKMAMIKQIDYSRIKELIRRYRTDIALPDFTSQQFISRLLHDKKAVSQDINFVLLNKLGSAIVKRIPAQEIYRYYREFRIDYN